MSYLYDLWDDFLSLLFPRICHGCGNHLVRNETLICTECYILIPRTDYHLKADNPVARIFWGRCTLERAAAFSYYTRDSRIRKLIHQLKYNGLGEIGSELGRIYGSILKSSDFLDGIDLIIPVPLHASKRRKRGYNQCDLIADGLSQSTGIPSEKSLLVRINPTKTQTTKSRYDRWTNVKDTFMLTDKERLYERHVLLVDDVITTGSTIEACTVAIQKEANVKVSVAALAFSAI
jgi:ComF family protein